MSPADKRNDAAAADTAKQTAVANGVVIVQTTEVDHSRSHSSNLTLGTAYRSSNENSVDGQRLGSMVPAITTTPPLSPMSPVIATDSVSANPELKSVLKPSIRFQNSAGTLQTASNVSSSSFDEHRAAAPSMDLERGETVIVKKPKIKVDNTASYDWSEFYALRGSVVLSILVPCLVLTAWGAAWTVAYNVVDWKWIAIQSQLITILSVVMGLLLVFRTNTAYDRYWEARRLWGTLFTHTRNLARFIWVSVPTSSPEDLLQKHAVMNLLIAYAVAVKHYLRFEEGHKYDDLHNLLIHLPEYAPGALHPDVDNLPLEISFHISSYIAKCRKGLIDVPTANSMMIASSGLVDCLSNFERVRDSPIPKAYSVHLKQVLMLYLLSLPFQIVGSLGWVTIPTMFIAAFTLLGIEAIGGEIENPFGFDVNDLDLDGFCRKIKGELEQIVSRPTSLDPNTWTSPVKLENFERLVTVSKRGARSLGRHKQHADQ